MLQRHGLALKSGRKKNKQTTKQNKTKQKSKRSILQYFTRMAEQRAFWQRNGHRAWASSAMLFATREMDIYLSGH